jgi:hypothetical protein
MSSRVHHTTEYSGGSRHRPRRTWGGRRRRNSWRTASTVQQQTARSMAAGFPAAFHRRAAARQGDR